MDNALNDQKLLELNAQGFIPGPNESEKEFLERVEYNKNLDLGFPPSNLNEAYPITKKRFGFTLDWVPLLYSNEKLSFFQGGCAWIFQQKEDSPIAAFFQLKKSYKSKEKYLGIYPRNELIAHEAFHIARMAYEEPVFEEYFAYQTSSSSFRRTWGPIIRNSKESALFLLSCLLFVLAPLFAPTWMLWITFLLPFSLAMYGVVRLKMISNKANRVRNQLVSLTNSTEKADHILCRLTDKEIYLFSKLQRDELDNKLNDTSSLRQRLLHLLK